MNDQDERHELLGRLETPPEFKDWASNTLPTPGISNGHQTMAEGRGTSEHETSLRCLGQKLEEGRTIFSCFGQLVTR